MFIIIIQYKKKEKEFNKNDSSKGTIIIFTLIYIHDIILFEYKQIS